MSRPRVEACTGPRPIRTDHIDENQHVVHGVYGLALRNGIRHNHLTFTWTAVRPYTLQMTATDPATGEPDSWFLTRSLARSGGKHQAVKVDPAGEFTFIEFTFTNKVTWWAINREWLATLVAITDNIVPAEEAQP
jgi:hypothetical protein